MKTVFVEAFVVLSVSRPLRYVHCYNNISLLLKSDFEQSSVSYTNIKYRQYSVRNTTNIFIKSVKTFGEPQLE